MGDVTAKRKTKGANFRVYVATSFPHATFCEIEKLARDFQLGKAEVVRALFLRGLEAYGSDGLLTNANTADLIKTPRSCSIVSAENPHEASSTNS